MNIFIYCTERKNYQRIGWKYWQLETQFVEYGRNIFILKTKGANNMLPINILWTSWDTINLNNLKKVFSWGCNNLILWNLKNLNTVLFILFEQSVLFQEYKQLWVETMEFHNVNPVNHSLLHTIYVYRPIISVLVYFLNSH